MNIETGKKYLKEKNYLEAKKIFLNLLNKGQNLILVNFFLGGIYFELQNYKKSKFYYEESLKYNPNSKEILINLAFLEQSFGKLEAAKNIYKKLISLNPYYIEAYYRIYLLNSENLKDENETLFKKILKDNNINLHERALVNYLLSKIQKKKKKYLLEIEYLKKSHIDIFSSKKKYNLQSNFYYEKVISKKFKKIYFSNLEKNKSILQKYFPIFIIGLPRSGSTLVETILSNNNEIKSSGENSIINMAILDQISDKIFLNNFNSKDFKFKIDYSKLESFVIKKFSNFFEINKNNRFIDKTLVNFFNIEIILTLFPNAKFLHCFRNINDGIISIYQSLLPTLSWTHNLNDITKYVDNYLRVIKYFKKKYPDKIMDINLEKLTIENEKMIKNIFSFCNIEWDKESLFFNRKKNLQIKTTSNVQLRGRVKTYDHDKYKAYKFILNEYRKKYKWL